jgi:hypothetical protein
MKQLSTPRFAESGGIWFDNLEGLFATLSDE